MLMGDDDDGAPNRVTMWVSHLAVACGSQPTNLAQLAHDKWAACMLRDDPMIAMLPPQEQVRSSRTCWPIRGDDGGVGSNRSNCMCSSLWRRGAVSATRGPSRSAWCSQVGEGGWN
jgi:hypothetical protein